MTASPASGSPRASITITVVGEELRHLFSVPSRLERSLAAANAHVRVVVQHLADLSDIADPTSTGASDVATSDVVVVDGGLFVWGVLGDDRVTTTTPAAIRADVERQISQLAKPVMATGARLFFMGVSTFDPSDETVVYESGSTTREQVAHAVDAAILALSVREAISFIDADRIVAELGAAVHVDDFLDYAAPVWDALADELCLVLVEFGFFDDRPTLVQTPRGALA